ncbi:hypothetical protein OX284_009060 [Flavobacterium sp. SUN046]|uniref:hypothetical protein n=1 Tax=Flavobacterium sp. SUN046 TaxID=3002440 RepID=UPI002DB6AEF9|nr:hypothetical protein [Flavobacterium sp. SUN046]MEC4049575.1 hypothetical protein [Flavobacterium sp. SUN046]
MAFKVIKIIDGETIQVQPNWEWTAPDGENLVGDTLKINGYKIQNIDMHSNYATDKLKTLLIDKIVVLKNPKRLKNENTKISCSVFINDIDVAYYFPEYRDSI